MTFGAITKFSELSFVDKTSLVDEMSCLGKILLVDDISMFVFTTFPEDDSSFATFKMPLVDKMTLAKVWFVEVSLFGEVLKDKTSLEDEMSLNVEDIWFGIADSMEGGP